MIGELQNPNAWRDYLEALQGDVSNVVAAESQAQTRAGLAEWRSRLDKALKVISDFSDTFDRNASVADRLILQGVLTDQAKNLGLSVERVARSLGVSV